MHQVFVFDMFSFGLFLPRSVKLYDYSMCQTGEVVALKDMGRNYQY